MSADVELQDKVAVFPKIVPMEYKYKSEKYYMRDCYPEYYDVVMNLLTNRDRDGVTVTGTPGIGKSVFMGYFYERYSNEHPNTTIIMTSFNRERALVELVIAKGGEELERIDLTLDTSAMERTMQNYVDAAAKALKAGGDRAKRDGQVLELMDGPPKKIPPHFQWVSFTSPNEHWEAIISKNTRTVRRVYMPVWTYPELSEATYALGQWDLMNKIEDTQVKVLQLRYVDDDIEKDERAERDGILGQAVDAVNCTVLEYRYKVFRGVPRVCFEEEHTQVKYQFRH